MFAEASRFGACTVAASYLFLRLAIIGSLRQSIQDESLLRRILDPFKNADRSHFRGPGETNGGITLPAELRQTKFARIRNMTERHDLNFRICGCKNSGLTSKTCHLTQLSVSVKPNAKQPNLW